MIGEEANKLYISTFHALCANILRKFGSYLGYDKNLSILTPDDSESLMAQCARGLEYELQTRDVRKIIWQSNDAREKLVDVDTSEFDSFFQAPFEARIAREYLDRMRKANQIDFSGLLSETIRLLEKDSEILEKLQDRFELIQVDEAQDTNLAQFKIVEMLGEHTNVLMVGDPDQSIYGWRGARFENIEDFIVNFSADVIRLPLNYRSTKKIVSTASRLISHNENREEVDFDTINPDGRDVDCFIFRNPDEEGSWIAHAIRTLMGRHGYKPHDFAVLYRANSMSRAIETGLLGAGIDYEVIGSRSFFDRMEVKDSLSMLKFYANPKDGIALNRFINKPTRRIGQGTVAKIEKYANDHKIDLIESMGKADQYINGANSSTIKTELKRISGLFAAAPKGDIGSLMQHLVSGMNYVKYLEEYDDKGVRNRQDNLEELYNSASQFKGDASAYLNKIALQSASDKESVDDCVSLMTIHASKGLEFPVVFMPCMDEGSMPSSLALQDRDNNAEEERRLAYVGMTRAKEHLIFSYPSTRLKRGRRGTFPVNTQPSRFLKECDVLERAKRINP